MIRVDFSLPVEFQEIPLEAVATAGEGQGPTNEATQVLRRVSRFLSDVGVVYAANCLHTFEGRPSFGSLAVAVVDYPYGHSATTAARGAVQAVLGTRGEGWSGGIVHAPCGPAAVFTGGRTQVLPAPLASDGGTGHAEVPTAQFHAMIPIPPPEAGGEGLHMCLVVFSTPQVAHWEKCYAPVVAGILRSLRFSGGVRP
ncbi:hypothetical protein ACFY6U_28460 [Streptomyces sp. NPDC013157]|uniref:hypothetical protein n=1 Tax=Streptomyces sp. NPDC013157 TaxID=3364861 RepID=UPI003687931A